VFRGLGKVHLLFTFTREWGAGWQLTRSFWPVFDSPLFRRAFSSPLLTMSTRSVMEIRPSSGTIAGGSVAICCVTVRPLALPEVVSLTVPCECRSAAQQVRLRCAYMIARGHMDRTSYRESHDRADLSRAVGTRMHGSELRHFATAWFALQAAYDDAQRAFRELNERPDAARAAAAAVSVRGGPSPALSPSLDSVRS